MAAHILAVIAFFVDLGDAADVQAVFRALNSVRRDFGGNPDDEHFVRLLGLRSAEYQLSPDHSVRQPTFTA